MGRDRTSACQMNESNRSHLQQRRILYCKNLYKEHQRQTRVDIAQANDVMAEAPGQLALVFKQAACRYIALTSLLATLNSDV